MATASGSGSTVAWDRLALAVDLLSNGRVAEEWGPPERVEWLDVTSGAYLAPGGHKAAAAREVVRATRFADIDRNIAGLAVGYKAVAGRETDVPCLRVYVPGKRPLKEIAPEDRVPPVLSLPGLGEIVTDVQVLLGPIEPDVYTAPMRPALGGYSVGHPKVNAGTIGCLVRRTDDSGDVFLLGNSHILADSGRAARGDDVWQPAKLDGGGSPDRIGRLADFVAFRMTPFFDNRVDAAIVGPVTKAECQSAIVAIGQPPQGVRTSVRVGDAVQKVGRTTGHQKGKVRALHATLAIPYPIGPVKFLDLVETDCYSAKGDSGALVMDGEGYALGLHMASAPGRSFFCPIAPVLKGLGVDVVTSPLP